jgi:hypothetical protein
MSAQLRGAIKNMTRAEYDRVKATNWSHLKDFAKSPAHYRHNLFAEHVDTDPKKLGRCVHLAILEPEVFAETCATWDGGTRRGKAWDAFKAENEGRELLKAGERALCLAISAAVQADKYAGPLLSNGRAEVSILWDYTVPAMAAGEVRGFTEKCKSRLDFVPHEGPIIDIKTCRDASPVKFGRAALSMDYLAQAAMYRDAWLAATGEERDYWLVAVETEPPHVVQPYVLTEAQLRLGRATYRKHIDTLVHCRAHNTWPAFNDGPMELQLPAWVLAEDEDSVDGLGITIGGAA